MALSNPNLPKLVPALRTYSASAFLHDLLAGITVGLVALPLAMAFGIASGVTPQAGLYTAVVAGFLISALGGSRTQIGGPTGAFVDAPEIAIPTYPVRVDDGAVLVDLAEALT